MYQSNKDKYLKYVFSAMIILRYLSTYNFNQIRHTMRLTYRSLYRFSLDFSNLSPKITSNGLRNYKVPLASPIDGYLTPTTHNHTVIMLHEWWGFNSSIVKTADHFASVKDAKLNVFVPDLYRGEPAKDAEDANHKMNHLDWGKALQDIDELKNHFIAKGHEVSIMGFCMGGALTYASVSALKGFKCGSVFYGLPDFNHFKVDTIAAKVIAHFGRLDPLAGFSDVKTAEKLIKLAQQNKKSNIEVRFYDNASHAFCNQDSKYFMKQARDKSFIETVAYFNH